MGHTIGGGEEACRKPSRDDHENMEMFRASLTILVNEISKKNKQAKKLSRILVKGVEKTLEELTRNIYRT